MGAGGVLAYQPLFFVGTGTNGVAVGTVVALGSAPVLTGLIDSLLRRRAPASRWFVATALCIAGVTMVSGVLDSGASLGGPDVLWSVAAGGCYAVYALSAKELMERGWPSQHAMGAMFGVAAAAASVPLPFIVGAEWLWTPRGLALVLWLGVIATALGYLLFGWGLARLPATTVTTLTLAEPLCATLLGIGLLHEQLSLVAASGLVVLAAGLAVLTVTRRRVGASTVA
ncbi:DMT family transporter [Acrocarpospora macrocephala]|nr:EamA family transporter [Acrocarpospora macrocephala]